MQYYKLLQLDREPFSNSPDPDYFFQSDQHLGCLQKLELSLRLKRGLNVVIGDVGTGKTTLCRQLIRNFAQDDEFETHLILDPSFDHPPVFLRMLHELFYGNPPIGRLTETELKERIKQRLFSMGVDRNKTLVLIIDEGQKISGRCGRLMCCLRYEDKTYEQLRKNLPNRKARVMTPEGEGIVLNTQILTQLVLVLLDASPKPAAFPVEDIEVISKQPGKSKPKPRDGEKGQQKERNRGQQADNGEPQARQSGDDGEDSVGLNEKVEASSPSQGYNNTAGEGGGEPGKGKKKRRRRRRKRKGGGGGGPQGGGGGESQGGE